MNDEEPRLCMYAEIPYLARTCGRAVRSFLRLTYYRLIQQIRKRLPYGWRKYFYPRNMRHGRK